MGFAAQQRSLPLSRRPESQASLIEAAAMKESVQSRIHLVLQTQHSGVMFAA
jgi:hypothetical protein